MTPSRLYTRREIEGLIAAGNTIVIKEKAVLRLNAWKDKHPGGGLVIEHMIGRDATDEINISHSAEILRSMQRYRIGRIEGAWVNFTPPIQGGVFRKHDHRECDKAKLNSPCAAGLDINHAEEPISKDEVVCETRQSPSDFNASQVQDEIDADLAKYPSLDADTQKVITTKFQALHQRLKDEGYYDCRFSEYGKEIVRYITLFALFVFFLQRGWYTTSACFLGLFWHQIMFSAHDAGHRGITHNLTIDTLIGIFIADLCCGLSIGWWKSSHNVHHLVPNHPEHDPDIQNVPLFATSPSFFSSIKSSYYGGFVFPWDAFANIAVRFQQYTYYPVMAFARFNLYVLSWAHLISPRSQAKGSTWWTRPTEIVGIAIYFFLYFYLLLYRSIPTWQSRAVFLLVSHLVTFPLHVQITLSHWGTSTADLGPAESFAQKQLRTTMDIECPPWLDFVHGGLQFQAVHHLFPRVPRHNLRRLQALVKDFCAETEIKHLICGFSRGNGVVLGKLQEVAEQAKLLAACQAHFAEVSIHGALKGVSE